MIFKKGVNHQAIIKAEAVLFYTLLLAHLIPLFTTSWFLTVDGPAHLYNSKLLLELFASNSTVQEFYIFNSALLPNWTGHFLQALFLKIFEASLAEKLVLSLYVLGLPLSVRYALKTIGAKNLYIVYFIFPVTYSFLFYYGFHNFNFGLIFYFLALSVWYKSRNGKLTTLRIFALVGLTLAIYFSHVLQFLHVCVRIVLVEL